jgi:heme exporter protein D
MFGQYAAFIIPSYIATFVVIAGLVIHARIDHARRRAEIAELEARGVRRRAAGNG